MKSIPPSRRLSSRTWVFAFLLGCVTLSGLYNLYGDGWGLLVRINVFLHPILGIAVTAWLVPSIFERLRSKVPGLSYAIGLSFTTIFFLALLRAFTLRYMPIDSSNRIAGFAFIVITVLGAYFLRWMIPLLPYVPRDPASLSSSLLLLLWFLSSVLGVIILVTGGGRRAHMLLDFHSFVGYLAAASGIVALALPRLGGIWRSGLPQGVIAALVLGLVVQISARQVEVALEPLGAIPPIQVHLSTVPLEHRVAGERDPNPLPVDAAWLQISKSCGTDTACHQGILEDAERSMHGISFSPPHIRKNLALLADEVGRSNERICSGCHVPAALARTGRSPTGYGDQPNLSCVVCHSISSVEIAAGVSSSYTLALDRAALEPFREAELEGREIDPLTRLEIGLNPAAHGRVFSRPLLGEDRFCQTCHHLHLEAAVRATRCVECHMSPRSALGLPGSERNHLFPGSNRETPAVLGLTSTADLITRWATGELLVQQLDDLYGPESAKPFSFGDQALANYRYFSLSSELDLRCTDGRSGELRIIAKNLVDGHSFPTGPFDLLESWVEVHVTDGNDQVVLTSGGLDAESRVEPGSHTLGGRLVAVDGEVLNRYRVWKPHRKFVDRDIPAGGAVVERYAFRIPTESDDFLNVTARLRYRKLGSDYWHWAYPDSSEVPPLELARLYTQYSTRCPPDGSASPEKASGHRGSSLVEPPKPH